MATVEPTPEYQNTVVTPTKEHALYIWIVVSETATDAEKIQIARVFTKLDCIVCGVQTERAMDNSISYGGTPPLDLYAGVGFGQDFYNSVQKGDDLSYPYKSRYIDDERYGDLPAKKCDIFVHAKCDSQGMLFELSKNIYFKLPMDSITTYDEFYGFVSRNGRDLSGYIDGTANPETEEDRIDVAVEKETGRSYAVIQKWDHMMRDQIRDTKINDLNKFQKWIGRDVSQGTELPPETGIKDDGSHLARIRGGNAYQQPAKYKIVRQSHPIGKISTGCGLFFIAYCKSTSVFEYMLDRMADNTHPDQVMLMSHNNYGGSYVLFPSKSELANI